MTTGPAQPDPPDEALIARSRQGDADALGTLLRRHERRLFNICLRMLNHRDDAADATQEALLRICQGLSGFKGRSGFGTWAVRIAMNQAITALRRRKTRQTQPLDGAAPNANPHTDARRRPAHAELLADTREPAPDSRVQQEDEHRRLLEALDTLDEHHRAVLILRDMQGMDYPDIAEALELPLGTVKSRLFRARLALREYLLKQDHKLNQPQPQPQSQPTNTNTP